MCCKQMLLIACLTIAYLETAPGADIEFERVDNFNQFTWGGVAASCEDWCTFESDGDFPDDTDDSDELYALVSGSADANTTNCSSSGSYLSKAICLHAHNQTTYGPDVAADHSLLLTNADGCDCDFPDDRIESGSNARATYKALDGGIVTGNASIITAECHNHGDSGFRLVAPNIYIDAAPAGPGFTVNGYVIDEVGDDATYFEDEWWPANLNDVFLSTKYVSENEELPHQAAVGRSWFGLGIGAHGGTMSGAAWSSGEQ